MPVRPVLFCETVHAIPQGERCLETILTVKDLSISFGSNRVLDGVNFELHEGEVLGVIGPNGAGKTVMLNILTGILKPTRGEILYYGEDVCHKNIVQRTKMGFGRTFQVPRSFEKMTAYENVMTGAVYSKGLSETKAGERAVGILQVIGLADKARTFAGKLGLLDRKRLEIGIALAASPKLLLLDEVAGGLTESEVVDILALVKNIKEAGISVIWIEHVLQTMLEGTDRIMLLAEGKDVICGLPREVMDSPEVERVYLGATEEDRDASLDPPPAPAGQTSESEVGQE